MSRDGLMLIILRLDRGPVATCWVICVPGTFLSVIKAGETVVDSDTGATLPLEIRSTFAGGYHKYAVD